MPFLILSGASTTDQHLAERYRFDTSCGTSPVSMTLGDGPLLPMEFCATVPMVLRDIQECYPKPCGPVCIGDCRTKPNYIAAKLKHENKHHGSITVSDRHTYEYDIDMNSDVAPARVLRMVKPGSKVLEIGAGPGSITRHLSGTLECDVVALEIDPSAIEKLKPFARSVYPMDLNDAAWSDIVREKDGVFDYVIAADVLEHVYDPWSVLSGMKSLLNDNGSVILSLPHVGHAAIAGCLVDEDFEYRDWGLLDRTHVRFFGIKNVQHLLSSQGMSIEQAEFVVRSPEMTEFCHRWSRLPQDVQSALQRNRYSHVFQVVSRSVPKERAVNDLYLMGQPVEQPDEETRQHWTNMMAGLPLSEEIDLQSTIGPVASGSGSRIDPGPLAKKKKKSLARLLGLKK
ncbi:class I SAM-dependent methyltransferase [uncultured Ruegeria sp.]|uniref:class I SAM-dependent methyltransferase n=1 Tax=uncultured Ruegeria sp. TaxID=259304 RepID=UPI002614274E|nr:class I SAM-dependent methyltransferase [uncultured Ruegeria sp.]